jgi:hypothetical protein
VSAQKKRFLTVPDFDPGPGPEFSGIAKRTASTVLSWATTTIQVSLDTVSDFPLFLSEVAQQGFAPPACIGSLPTRNQRVESSVNTCPYVICRVECDVLRPVQQVDSLETAYSHMNELRSSWPGDYLILEQDGASGSGRKRSVGGGRPDPAKP